MSYAVEVRGLHKSYDTFSLSDISFTLPRGCIMGFIGPNGAGKTTTIKAILNMIHYQAGEIRLFGADGKSKANWINEQIGVVMDTPLYVGDWTVSDVEKAVSPFYRQWDTGEYARLLQTFEIEKKKKVKELSRGMKVKLMIAVALSHKASLLILDEPTSGLDPVARDELCDMLRDFVADGDKSVLFSTHITADLEKIADYIAFILRGQIVFSGSKESLLEKYVLVKGGPQEIRPEQRELLLGLREDKTGFEGLAERVNVGKLPQGLLIKQATLDEIMIYINKEAKRHA